MSEFVPYAASIRDFAETQPDKDALIIHTPHKREAYTYRQYNEKMDAFAAEMATCGVDAESGVIVVSPNSSAAAIASSAAWRLGAFVAPISVKSTQSDLDAVIANMKEAKSKIFVLSDHVLAKKNAKNISLESLHKNQAQGLIRDHAPSPARAIPSGGTTGRAKLIVDETPWGRNSDATIIRALNTFGWADADRILVYSPLYHNVGQTLTHLALMQGQTAVLMDRFDAARAQTIIQNERIEFFFAVPTHIQRWMDLPGLNKENFATVKSMYHAGAICSKALKEKWIAFLGADRIWELFGATDGTGLTIIHGEEWLRHKGSVGRPFSSDIRILDDKLNSVPNGEVGQIYMKMHGAAADDPGFKYLGAPTPLATPEGYRTVGDMGWLDEDGYLFIADRRTDMIITGGANVFPAEVEAALRRHPGIGEVAVIGLPDEKWGRRVHAIIVAARPDAAPTPSEIDSFMSTEIVAYKKPKTYSFRHSLLYTDVDKLDRKRLIEECLSGEATDDSATVLKNLT
ncbi:MAG: AMP-binding protein [Pseudomonadota bacterium]